MYVHIRSLLFLLINPMKRPSCGDIILMKLFRELWPHMERIVKYDSIQGKTFFLSILFFFLLSLYSLKTLFCVALFCFLAKKSWV